MEREDERMAGVVEGGSVVKKEVAITHLPGKTKVSHVLEMFLH